MSRAPSSPGSWPGRWGSLSTPNRCSHTSSIWRLISQQSAVTVGPVVTVVEVGDVRAWLQDGRFLVVSIRGFDADVA